MVALARRLGVAALSARCHTQHLASQRVLEKCGFIRVGVCEIDFPNLAPVRQGAIHYTLQLRSVSATRSA